VSSASDRGFYRLRTAGGFQYRVGSLEECVVRVDELKYGFYRVVADLGLVGGRA
jgi:hypothetical protein